MPLLEKACKEIDASSANAASPSSDPANATLATEGLEFTVIPDDNEAARNKASATVLQNVVGTLQDYVKILTLAAKRFPHLKLHQTVG